MDSHEGSAVVVQGGGDPTVQKRMWGAARELSQLLAAL